MDLQHYVAAYVQDLQALLPKLDEPGLVTAIEWMRETRDADGTVPVSPGALAVLRAYVENDLSVATRQRLAPAVRAETGRILEAFLTAQFENYRGLRSLRLAASTLE